MNLRKGFKRLVFTLSLIPVLIGIIVFIAGLVDGDDDMLIGGLLTVLIGFGAIWAIYGIVLYIIKGFNANYCDLVRNMLWVGNYRDALPIERDLYFHSTPLHQLKSQAVSGL